MRPGVGVGVMLLGFRYRTLLSKGWKLANFKWLEVELFHNFGVLFSLEAVYKSRSEKFSHQGLDIELWLLSLGVRVAWYDSRHGEDREEVDTDPPAGTVQG